MKTLFGVMTLNLVALSWVGISGPVYSQAPSIWSGQAQCQLNFQNPDYAHQETQTWTITGPSTSAPDTIQVYPGTWSASGKGALQRIQGPLAQAAQWSSAVPNTNAPIAIFIRASDKRLIIKLWHSQLSVPGAITGVRQVSTAGAAPTQSTIGNAGWEWPFPAIEDVGTSTSVVGSGTIVVSGGLLPMGSPAVNATATCKWQFSKGSGGSAQPDQASQTQALTPGVQTPNTGLTGPRSTSTSPASSSSSPLNQQTDCAIGGVLGGSNGPNNPIILGTISPGMTSSGSRSLSSATDRHFYQVTLAAGTEANISLSGDAASDLDLYLFHPDLTPVGCSTIRGTSAESFKTTFGATQTSTTIFIAVSPYSWNAAAASYSLNVSGVSSSLQTAAGATATTGPRSTSPSPVIRSTSPLNQQTDCAIGGVLGGSNGPNNPIILGTISPGMSSSGSRSLSSAADRHFYQLTLTAGTEANISLSGDAGSDFDLYLFHPDLTPVGCSMTRGTSSESLKTAFGATQTSNTILVAVSPSSWSAAAASYTLDVSGVPAGSTSTPTSGTTTTSLPKTPAQFPIAPHQ